MTLTLADVLSAPTDADQLRDHLRANGTIPTPITNPIPGSMTSQPVPEKPISADPSMTPSRVPTSVRDMNLMLGSHETPHTPTGAIPDLNAGAPKFMAPTPEPDAIKTPTIGPLAPLTAAAIPSSVQPSGFMRPETGREQYERERPQVTATPGTSDYYRQQLERDEYDRAHPLGADVSERPGFLGKLEHGLATAGNIAGEALIPHVMANIPGTAANKAVRTATEEKELGEAETRERQAAQEKAQEENLASEERERVSTEAKNAAEQTLAEKRAGEIGKPTTEEGKVIEKLMTGGEGGGPQINPDTKKPYTDAEAFQFVKHAAEKTPEGEKSLSAQEVTQLNAGLKSRYQVLNPGKELPAEFQIPANASQKDYDRIEKQLAGTESATATKQQRDTAEALRLQAKNDKEEQENEKKEEKERKWVTGEEPGTGRTVMVPLSQAKSLGLQNLAEANTDDINKTKAARHVVPLLFNGDAKDPGIYQMVQKLNQEGKLGPIASRWNDFMARKYGADDPEYAALRARLDLATTKMMQAHVGSRGGAFMLEHFENIANARKMGAADLLAGIDQEIRYMHDVAQQPSRQRPTGGGEDGGQAKTATSAQVSEFARKNGVSFDEAKKHFEQSNYTVH
jgi:hypothetical protein